MVIGVVGDGWGSTRYGMLSAAHLVSILRNDCMEMSEYGHVRDLETPQFSVTVSFSTMTLACSDVEFLQFPPSHCQLASSDINAAL